MISSILSRYPSNDLKKIGLYTSPHLRFVRERIQINNEPLSEEQFAKYFFETWDALEAAAKKAGHPDPQDPTTKPVYFRFLTLMAFHTYLKEGVDTAVIECGIGGEYDSTNILVNPSVTGITSLGIDHTAMLGDTIEQIAWHKAGVFKPGVPAYTAPQPDAAIKVLQQRSKERNTELHIAELHPDLTHVELGLDAEFQKMNASLAIQLAAAHLHNINNALYPTPSVIHEHPLPPEFVTGLQQVRWPGRCEIRPEKNLTWYIDGGHTLESIALAGTWFASRIHPNRKAPTAKATADLQTNEPILPSPVRVLIFNQQQRDATALARSLHAVLSAALGSPNPFTHVIFCTNTTFVDAGFAPDLVSINVDAAQVESLSVQQRLAETWQELDPQAETQVVRTIEEAVEVARRLGKEREGMIGEPVEVLVTGSLHLVGGLIDVLESRPEAK